MKRSRASRAGCASAGPSTFHIHPCLPSIGESSVSVRTAPETVASPHFLLSALVWPQRSDGSSNLLRSAILVVLGTALLTLSAKVNLPLPYVPMTLQTLVVLMIGAAYGWRLGSATLLPIHWGTFSLAMHAWDEPAETLLSLALARNAPLLLPKLGAAVEPGIAPPPQPWWRTHGTAVAAEMAPAEDARMRELPWPLD